MGMQLVHSGPVVTHRLASGAQPAGQQVWANAGDISAYAKTRITSLRYPMPFPSLTPIWGRKLVLAPNRPDTAAEIVEHKKNILIIAIGTIEGDRSDLRITQLPVPTGIKPMAVESFRPAASGQK